MADALTPRRPAAGANVTTLARSDAAATLFHEREPERRVTDLVLPTEVRQLVNELIEEHHRRDLLRSHGVNVDVYTQVRDQIQTRVPIRPE